MVLPPPPQQQPALALCDGVTTWQARFQLEPSAGLQASLEEVGMLTADSIEDSGSMAVSALAWTTTPWTLPSNRALAINPIVPYVLVKVTWKHSNGVSDGSDYKVDGGGLTTVAHNNRADEVFLLAAALVDQVCSIMGCSAVRTVVSFRALPYFCLQSLLRFFLQTRPRSLLFRFS